MRPIFLRRIQRLIQDNIAEGGTAQVHQLRVEDIIALVEASSGRELLDMMANGGLPPLEPDIKGIPTPVPPGESVIPAPRSRRGGLRRSGFRNSAEGAAGAERRIHEDREALLQREQEFEEQFLRRPLEAVAPDAEIASTAERYVVNHPGTCLVRYFAHGPAGAELSAISAMVIRENLTRMVRLGPVEEIRALADGLAAVHAPSYDHAKWIWSLLVAPIWDDVSADGLPDHLVVVPTDELFTIPFHVASEHGLDSTPLGALVPLSQSVSLSAFLTRGRHLLRRQRVEPDDHLAALVVGGAGISAQELVRAEWPAQYTILAGAAPEGLSADVRRYVADWAGLDALSEVRPEFFVYTGHGSYHPTYGALGPYLAMPDVAGKRERLTSYDIARRVRLPRNRLTILAACLAGQGVPMPGGDVGGFLRAFMAAGAGAIAVPLWSVLDSAVSVSAGELLAASRRQATASRPYDVVATLHEHYLHLVNTKNSWIEHLPLALYT